VDEEDESSDELESDHDADEIHAELNIDSSVNDSKLKTKMINIVELKNNIKKDIIYKNLSNERNRFKIQEKMIELDKDRFRLSLENVKFLSNFNEYNNVAKNVDTHFKKLMVDI